MSTGDLHSWLAHQARVLANLGVAEDLRGRYQEAAAHYEQALDLYRQIGNLGGEAWALNGLGEAALAAGRPADALTHHTTALSTSPLPEHQARAHTGLGHAHRALGDPARGRHHYEHALTRYTDLGSPNADDVRAHLTALDAPPDAGHHQHD